MVFGLSFLQTSDDLFVLRKLDLQIFLFSDAHIFVFETRSDCFRDEAKFSIKQEASLPSIARNHQLHDFSLINILA